MSKMRFLLVSKDRIQGKAHQKYHVAEENAFTFLMRYMMEGKATSFQPDF